MNKIKATILFTVLIDIVGFGIVIPVLPFYVESFGAGPRIITLLFAVFSLCSFISAPFLGALSDRIGRRPVLIISILSTSLGWFVFASARNILFLFLGRIIDGMAAGNISTAQSFLVDISKTPEERTRNLGLIGSVFGIGFILGPMIGGFLSIQSHAFPFWFVGFMALFNVILAWFFLPETNNNRDHSRKINFNPLLPILRALKNKPLHPNFSAWFFFVFSISLVQSIFALYLHDIFGFGATIASLFFTVSGIIIAINQTFLLRKFWLKNFSERSLQVWLLIGGAIGYLISGQNSIFLFVLGSAIAAFCQPVIRVTMTSYAIGKSHSENKGEILGILNSISSVGMIAGPILGGLLFPIDARSTFFFSALAMLVAFAIAFFEKKTTLDLSPENPPALNI